ncbi:MULTISPECIES: hypothetical protein [unclassified Mucilaginibacter]|uniref:hypothetical protein n=1 Tax=unclassified Mucilaginibacter TaxID=2617802 RepID=UPI0031F62643
MQTPKKTVSNSASFKSAAVNTAEKPAEQKRFDDEDDFDNDFNDEPLDDLDYDGANRYDDEDDDY